jgi:hypothetical protein
VTLLRRLTQRSSTWNADRQHHRTSAAITCVSISISPLLSVQPSAYVATGHLEPCARLLSTTDAAVDSEIDTAFSGTGSCSIGLSICISIVLSSVDAVVWSFLLAASAWFMYEQLWIYSYARSDPKREPFWISCACMRQLDTSDIWTNFLTEMVGQPRRGSRISGNNQLRVWPRCLCSKR